MNLTLKNDDFLADGIFGTLSDENNQTLCVTLQHAYDSANGDGSFLPKLPPGVYKCVRGQHQLASMHQPFTTFEITGVLGHTNILFHQGNYDKDSEGCVLLGVARSGDMILHSAIAFKQFMQLQDGIDFFTLTVI